MPWKHRRGSRAEPWSPRIRPRWAGPAVLMLLGPFLIASVGCAGDESRPANDAATGHTAMGNREGLPVVPWRDARQVIRHRAIVFGEIVRVGGTKNIEFLNFSKADRDAFVAVIFARSLPSFPRPLAEMYLHQRVEVEGHVTLFEGNPQIVVTHPRQIRIIQDWPETHLPPRVTAPSWGKTLKVATLNVRNLFDAFDDPYTHDESTPEKPRTELEALAQTIRAVNADVLALQEVENRGVLERFLEIFLSDMGYRHVVLVEGNDLRGIDVALVSRAPLGEVRSHAPLRFDREEQGANRFMRDLLCVDVRPPQGTPFEIWVVHLKSKGGDGDTESIRLAEARQIRQLVDDRLRQDPQAQFLICGDFNDEWSSRSLQTIVGDPGPGQLVSFFTSIAPEDRITFNQEPYRSMIDFFLSSPAMARRYVDGSYQIFLEELSHSGTDHNPVAMRIQMVSPPAEESTGSNR